MVPRYLPNAPHIHPPCSHLHTPPLLPPPEDLPDTFGFDKYGLMVHKEFAVDLPGPDGTGTTEAPAVSETNIADITGPPEQQNITALDMLALAA